MAFSSLGRLTVLCLFWLSSAAWTEAAAVPGHIIAWGHNFHGQTTPPPGLNDVIAVAAGTLHSLALRSNGTVVSWGRSALNAPLQPLPPGLTNVVAIAAQGHSVALKADGTVVVWNGYNNEALVTNVPPGLNDVIAVAAGGGANGNVYTLALRRNGTVVAWGNNPGDLQVPAGLSNVVQISAGSRHSLALKSDGTIVGWGPPSSALDIPPGLANIRAVQAGQTTSLAVTADGQVIKWGGSFDGNDVPPGTSGIVALDTGNQHVLALRTNRTVVAWGVEIFGQASVPEQITGVTYISAGGNHNLVVTARPRLLSITPTFFAQVGDRVTFTVSADGEPLNYQWQHKGTNLPGQTAASLVLDRSRPEQGGSYSVVVSNAYGFITASSALVFPPPVINAHPVGRTVYRGEDVTLAVNASGLEPLTYQWVHSGTNLPGANLSSLIVARVGPSRTGKYRVVVTDVAGSSVTSAEAEINVIDPRPKTVVLTPSMDTSIYSSGTKPQGNSTILSGRRGNGIVDRALLRFDLSAIPTNAVVQSAQLELLVVRAPSVSPVTFQLHRLLTTWDTSASWLQATSVRQWSAPGGAPGIDFGTRNTAGIVGVGVSTFRGLFGPSTEMQTDLEAWIQDPSSNAGWILICAAENVSKTARHFGASESEYPARLTVSYEVSARTPEIASAALDEGSFSFRIDPDPGWFYIVETRDQLDQGGWTVLTNIAAGAALNPISVTLPGTNQQQFFRVNRN